MTDYLVMITTVSDMAVAKLLAHRLLDAKMAACVNVIPSVTSVYLWQGEVCETQECQLFIKIHNSLYEQASILLRTIHPYQLPEIIAIPIAAGLPEYLGWIKESIQA